MRITGHFELLISLDASAPPPVTSADPVSGKELLNWLQQNGKHLDWALAYARSGKPVLPLGDCDAISPDTGKGVNQVRKRPIIQGGKEWKNASTDESVIRQWWSDNPKANIGIVCKPEWIAIDIDRHAGEPDGVERFRNLPGYEKLPATIGAETNNQGRHIIFQGPPMVASGEVDIKGEIKLSGIARSPIQTRYLHYIAVEPSVHPTGSKYRWEDGKSPFEIAPAAMPDWLLRHILKAPEERTQTKNHSCIGNGLTDEEVRERMFASKHGAEIKALWSGDISKYDGDNSRADSALAFHLAYWTAKHYEQMERLFFQSELGKRPKWIERDKSYREPTLRKACNKVTAAFSPTTRFDDIGNGEHYARQFGETT